MQKTDRNHIRPSVGDKTLTVSVILITALFALVVFIPLWNIVVSSFSDVNAVLGGRVSLWPVDFSLDGYKAVLSNKDVGTGYLNTLAYTVIGTIVNISVTMICAYPLTRRELPFRGLIMFLFTFTMFFGGGLIASYLNISNLHMINTFWVMILPGAMSVYNMVLARTFIQSSIPNDLMEAARIDGCSYTRYFFKIVLPLSPAILAVLALNYAVGHWNSYFSALIYLRDRSRFPLQLFLREILIANTIDDSLLVDPESNEIRQGLADVLKYALIVISTLPVLCFYPFAQRYFMQGIMIGSLKG
ncbi:MAG: carbohydrate ABC transporter permease [Eubacteriales bacterium]|mgnify:FL=1|jgi:putative aldouronate transport system permease protein|nr:carbohydrate ABC transporter permease [Eubacteriales bacterium]